MYRKANGLGEFYSISKANGNVELFLDRERRPTIDYPHVHVVHHAQSGNVDVIASVTKGKHSFRTTLTRPSGGQVESAIGEACQKLPIIDPTSSDYETAKSQLQSTIKSYEANGVYDSGYARALLNLVKLHKSNGMLGLVITCGERYKKLAESFDGPAVREIGAIIGQVTAERDRALAAKIAELEAKGFKKVGEGTSGRLKDF